MKKTFLLFLTTVTLLMGGGALSELKAQDDVVEIVAKTGDAISKSRHAPLNNNENYSISQIYYTAEEIGRPDGGFIHNIAFKTYDNGDGNYPYKREIEIYMVNTDEAVFSARTMKQLSAADRVFSGTVEFTAEEWVNITLTPFQYEGGNLLICVNDKFVDNYVSPVAYFYAFSSGTTMRCLNTYNHADYQYKPTDLAITKSKGTSGSTLGNTGTLPYIRLTFGEGSGSGEGGDEPATPVAPATPANLTASATETTVVLSWDAVDGASYNVYQGENLLASVTETTYTVENLTANTSYTFTVKAVKDQLESDAATVTVTTEAEQGNEGEDEDTTEPIYINANTASITANGIDVITFTVTQGEDGTGDIVSDADIYVNGEKIDGNTFTTIVAGNYTAYAMKDGTKSNEITFTAVIPELALRVVADKYDLYANGTDMATFTVYEEGMGTEDVTADAEIYVNGEKIDGNTFSTTEEGIYTIYAKKDDLQSETISISAKEWVVLGWVSNADVKKIYPDDNYENTVNISNGHFTLWMTITGNNYDNGIILNNNYWVAGEGTNESYGPRENHRPSTPQPLSLPSTIYVDGIGIITITEIKDHVFYNRFDAPSQLGNELNNNISSLTIPSSITTIGNNAFNFTMNTDFVIRSKALVPPTIQDYTFGGYAETNTGNYGKAILYVHFQSVGAYKAAEYWKRFYKIIADPSTMPTFIGHGEWTDASNWYSNAVPADGSMVRIAGEAYISTTVNTSNITVDGNASITIGNSGILYAEAAITNNGTIIMEDGGQLYYNATDDLIVTYKKVIAGYGEDDSVNDGWYTISSPVYSYSDGGYKYNEIDEITNLIPLNDDSRHYDLYRYYEEGDYDEYDNLCGWWENYKMGEDQMDYNNLEFTSFASGRGYLYASSQDVTLEFTGKVETNHTLYFCTTMNGEEQFCGFNLVGNPFTHNITADNFTGLEIGGGFFTVDNAGVWTTHLPNEEIKPAQGVLIKVFEEGDLDIKKEISRGRSNNGAIAITVTNGKYSDNAFVSFNAGKGLNKYPHLNKNAHKVYVTVEDTDYAIATMNDNVKEIPVSFEAMTMGQYTISVNTQDCKYNSMILIDKMSGIKTDLLNESYTFIATTDDDKDRFIVMLNADNDTDNSFIYINNNEMIIDNIDGQGVVYIYDIMGRPMAEYDVNGSARISTDTFANGVYIVRMTDGNGVKTQKLTINN